MSRPTNETSRTCHKHLQGPFIVLMGALAVTASCGGGGGGSGGASSSDSSSGFAMTLNAGESYYGYSTEHVIDGTGEYQGADSLMATYIQGYGDKGEVQVTLVDPSGKITRSNRIKADTAWYIDVVGGKNRAGVYGDTWLWGEATSSSGGWLLQSASGWKQILRVRIDDSNGDYHLLIALVDNYYEHVQVDRDGQILSVQELGSLGNKWETEFFLQPTPQGTTRPVVYWKDDMDTGDQDALEVISLGEPGLSNYHTRWEGWDATGFQAVQMRDGGVACLALYYGDYYVGGSSWSDGTLLDFALDAAGQPTLRSQDLIHDHIPTTLVSSQSVLGASSDPGVFVTGKDGLCFRYRPDHGIVWAKLVSSGGEGRFATLPAGQQSDVAVYYAEEYDWVSYEDFGVLVSMNGSNGSTQAVRTFSHDLGETTVVVSDGKVYYGAWGGYGDGYQGGDSLVCLDSKTLQGTGTRIAGFEIRNHYGSDYSAAVKPSDLWFGYLADTSDPYSYEDALVAIRPTAQGLPEDTACLETSSVIGAPGPECQASSVSLTLSQEGDVSGFTSDVEAGDPSHYIVEDVSKIPALSWSAICD